MVESSVAAPIVPVPTASALLTSAFTLVNADESLIASAFAMADERACVVETVSSAVTVARMVTPLMTTSFASMAAVAVATTALPSARAWRPRMRARASVVVRSIVCRLFAPTWNFAPTNEPSRIVLLLKVVVSAIRSISASS